MNTLLNKTGIYSFIPLIFALVLFQSCSNTQAITSMEKPKQKRKADQEIHIRKTAKPTTSLCLTKAVALEWNAASDWQKLSTPEPLFKWDRKLKKAVSANTLKKRNEQYKVLEPSCKNSEDYKDFEFHTRTYSFDADLDAVWNAYTTVTPDKAWKGPLNNYEKSYSRQEDFLYTPESDAQPTITEGMIYFLRLRIAKIMNVHVSFEITKISREQGIIEFTYMRNNKSHGRQVLKFTEENGKTKLVHTSRFYSGKKIRDKFLYAPFHEKCIDEFHANIKELIREDQSTEPLIAIVAL